VPSNALITRTSVKGCEALRLRREVPPTEGEGPDRGLALRRVRPPKAGSCRPRETCESIGTRSRSPVTIEDQPEAAGRRPATWTSWLTGHLRTDNRGTSGSRPMTFPPQRLRCSKACVLRSTVRLTARERRWASRARTHLDQFFRRLPTAKKEPAPCWGPVLLSSLSERGLLGAPSR
jgi:hypothetical protein